METVERSEFRKYQVSYHNELMYVVAKSEHEALRAGLRMFLTRQRDRPQTPPHPVLSDHKLFMDNARARVSARQ